MTTAALFKVSRYYLTQTCDS